MERQRLIGQVTGHWMEYVTWRRKRKSSYGIADNHFRKKALPRYWTQKTPVMTFVTAKLYRYFAAMREFVVCVNYKREILERAQKFKE